MWRKGKHLHTDCGNAMVKPLGKIVQRFLKKKKKGRKTIWSRNSTLGYIPKIINS